MPFTLRNLRRSLPLQLATITAAFFLVLMAGCVRDKHIYTIEGQLLTTCNGHPLANKELSFFQPANMDLSGTTGGEVGRATTDTNGFFRFSYEAKNDLPLKIQEAAGVGYNTILEGVPARKDLAGLKVYYRATTSVRVSLQVQNAYTANDTLYLTDLRNPQQFLKKPGPFASSFLYDAVYTPMQATFEPATANFGYKLGHRGQWVQVLFRPEACTSMELAVPLQ